MPQVGLYGKADADADIATHAALPTVHQDAPDLILTHKGILDAHTKNINEILRTGEYWQSPAGSITTGVIAADTLYTSLLVVPRDITVDYIVVKVSGLKAGASARLGIYNNGTNLYPGTLLLDAGEVSVASTGAKPRDIDPTVLVKGIYHLAIVSDDAPTIGEISRASQVSFPLGTDPTNIDRGHGGWTVAFTYAALPDPFPTSATLIILHAPFLPVRIKSLD